MPDLSQPLPIATRKSPLALVQAYLVQAKLAAAHGIPEHDRDRVFPILGLVSTGDKIQDRTLLEAGGKGLFTKEIDEAQLGGDAVFAVHSMKDVPTVLPERLILAAILEREDPRDMLLARGGETRLADLPEGALIGTASLRRQAQLLHARPDLSVIPLRGNVDTRLKKLRDGDVYATFLARAGLKRLERAEAEAPALDIAEMLPAAAQGAIGVTVRADDANGLELVRALNHEHTERAIAAERGFLEALDGSCRTPIAAHVNMESLDFLGEVLSPDGRTRWRESTRLDLSRTNLDDAAEAGRKLANAVRQQAGDKLKDALGMT
ncbi:MAG: hydroxymethylbilane synthase [Alphaproteobacteria bacterium]|nr:hydroxymethylbilane synthase [Alphaproteobacteria bacterium]